MTKGVRIVEAEARSSTSFWPKHGGTSLVAAFANFERLALSVASFFFPTMMWIILNEFPSKSWSIRTQRSKAPDTRRVFA